MARTSVTTGPALSSFVPGAEGSFVLPERWGGQLRATTPPSVGSVCEVEVPSRLHACVLDMTRFDTGTPGGGGIGIAVALYCSARVELTPDPGIEVSGTRPSMARHFARLFQVLTGYEGGLIAEVRDHGCRHMGLGSSIGTLTALAVALNEVSGRPLALRDLRKLIAHNYCEELAEHPGRLIRGFETNVGAMAGIHGGMVLASNDCQLIYRTPLPRGTRALLLLPHTGPPVASGADEAAALMSRARALDRRDGAAKAHKVLMDLLPAMARTDLEAMGEVIASLSHIGSKKAECELHGNRGREVYDLIHDLRRRGAEIVSMSSVGPAVFAVSRRPEVLDGARRWQNQGIVDQVKVVAVDNAGARVRLDGVPIPYRYEAW